MGFLVTNGSSKLDQTRLSDSQQKKKKKKKKNARKKEKKESAE